MVKPNLDQVQKIMDTLEEHLSDGCLDSRCEVVAYLDKYDDPVVEFPTKMLRHLAESVLESLEED